MFDYTNYVNNYLEESVTIAEKQKDLTKEILDISKQFIDCIENNGKIIVFGNGGSASDSLHIVAELIGRFKKERKALPAISLSSNISVITAIANDYGYENIFLKQIEGVYKDNDVIFAISTSGESENIIKALDYSKKKGLKTVGFTGSKKNRMINLCDLILKAPSENPALIQQCHITVGQLICGIVEDYFFRD
tara:strand:- start:3534 stop:4112 length:579 start_codon:yes stop_codon:yes gene_type:complete